LLPFSPEPSVFSLLSENIKIRIYKTIILPVALYGCQTWSLTLREEHRLRVFENRNAYKILVGKPKEKSPLGRPRLRWVCSIKWILERQDGVVLTGLIWLRIGTSRRLL
jgi:hypothetical protein